jgi:hypothetical protein
MSRIVWTAELIRRRRGLHTSIDGLADTAPAAAARLRLALYTTTHDADRGDLDEPLLDLALAVIEDDVAAVVARAA